MGGAAITTGYIQFLYRVQLKNWNFNKKMHQSKEREVVEILI